MTDAVSTKASQNKFEKLKAEKDGLAVKTELDQFASIGWEAMDETDREHRLKWVGVFFRPVTPGKFMMRMRIPNGIVTSNQMRVLGEVVQRYGDDGNADITITNIARNLDPDWRSNSIVAVTQRCYR